MVVGEVHVAKENCECFADSCGSAIPAGAGTSRLCFRRCRLPEAGEERSATLVWLNFAAPAHVAPWPEQQLAKKLACGQCDPMQATAVAVVVWAQLSRPPTNCYRHRQVRHPHRHSLNQSKRYQHRSRRPRPKGLPTRNFLATIGWTAMLANGACSPQCLEFLAAGAGWKPRPGWPEQKSPVH